MNQAVLPDSVLTPLCEPFSKQADWLLELYEMTQKPNRKAGLCLKCFYALFESADSIKRPALQPLKTWIEQNVEITVKGGERPPISRPIHLDSVDFESFCSATIESVRADQSVAGDLVEMHVRFKGGKAA